MFKRKEVNGPGKNQIEDSVVTKISIGSPNGILPKITSTPLNPGTPESRKSRMLQPLISRQETPRRYLLSDTYSPVVRHSNPYAVNSPGPLLASMSFADNVSMYEETKSSGLAKRIVSYREAQQEQQATHQEKYHSPGLFPVVHLFKNTSSPLPTRKVKVKLASPEYLRSYSPQHRSKILEEISKPRLHRQLSLPAHAQNNDTSTKTVLDALKEISRKRIHSNEDVDHLEELGKRQKTESYNGKSAGSSKRGRADSPLSDQPDSPTFKQSQKKFCVYDEFAASKSSSDFSYFAKSELTKSKRKAINTSIESLLVKPKQVKVVNVETQTPPPVTEKKPEPEKQQPDEPKKDLRNNKDFPLKVFDDAPLQRIRKSRLAALMGTMLGKDIVIPIEETTNENISDLIGSPSIKKTTETVKATEEIPPKKTNTDSAEGALKSILTHVKSTGEAAKPKVVEEKHVHFSVPTPISLASTQASSTQISSSTIPELEKQKEAPIVPVVSSSSENQIKTTSEKPAFGFASTAKKDSAVASEMNPPMFNFAKSATETMSESESKTESVVTTSPPKIGGFKFDLKAPTVSKSTTPTLTFPVATSTMTVTTAADITTTSLPNFSFGTTAVTSASAALPFGQPTNQTKPTFAFGTSPKSDIFASSSDSQPTESKSNTAAPSVTTASFGFGSSQQADGVAAGLKFGAVATQCQQPSNFVNSLTPVTTVNLTTAASSVFGSVTDQSMVSKPPQPTFLFGGANSAFTPKAGFSTITTASSTPSSSVGGVGGSANTVSNSSTAFGGFGATPSKPAVFGSNTTTASIFGATAVTTTSFGANVGPTSAFGANTTPTPSFGVNSASLTRFSSNTTTTTTTTSMFSGAPATTTSTTFENATYKFPTSSSSLPAFGQNLTSTSTASAFAAPTTTTPSFKPNAFGSNTFGNGNAPTFGTSTAPTNQNTSSVFGSSNAFAAPSTTTTNQNVSPFGGGAFTTPLPTTTTAPSMFGTGGSTATSTFTFGANKQQPNPFGGSIAATSTVGSSFGSSSSFSSSSSSTAGGFGSGSGFGTTASAFGNAQKSTFGPSSTPSFSQSENKPTFNFGAKSTEPKTAPSFGAGATVPSFVVPTTNNQGFGSGSAPKSGFGSGSAPSSGFGSANPNGGFGSQLQTNSGFNFGQNNAGANAPFGFGSNTNSEILKPTFNFTGSSNPPAFGSGSTSSFGSASFTGQPQQFLTGGAPAGGVFTIGSGSTPGSRPRAQIRAKRRT